VTEFEAADVFEPYVFDAVTVNVYAVPFVSPVIEIGDPPVPVKPPGLDVAVYVTPPEPALPAVYVTVAEASPAEAVPIVGALGLIPGVCAFDAAEVAEPYAFVAVTVKVYEVPAVRPVTVIGEAPEPEPPAGLDVTLYVTPPEPTDPAV
jgi:hypothetical protein